MPGMFIQLHFKAHKPIIMCVGINLQLKISLVENNLIKHHISQISLHSDSVSTQFFYSIKLLNAV